MKWAHLPEPGGIYAQNPELLDHFAIIFAAQAKEDARREAEKNSKKNDTGTLGSRKPRGNVRRRR
jgi:hypothetical protein